MSGLEPDELARAWVGEVGWVQTLREKMGGASHVHRRRRRLESELRGREW